MPAGNKTDEVCTGEPTVNEQTVESDAALDGILHHLDGLVNLRHRVLLDAFLDSLSAMILAIPRFALLVRQPLLLGKQQAASVLHRLHLVTEIEWRLHILIMKRAQDARWQPLKDKKTEIILFFAQLSLSLHPSPDVVRIDMHREVLLSFTPPENLQNST